LIEAINSQNSSQLVALSLYYIKFNVVYHCHKI